MHIWQQLLNGISMGSVYGLFALGYTLVFSILGVINFAHGAVFAVGAYTCYLVMGGTVSANGMLHGFSVGNVALPFWAALWVAAVVSGLLNLAIEYGVLRYLRRRRTEGIFTLVATLGLGLLLVHLLQLLFGAEIYALPGKILGDLPPAINFGSADQPIPIRTTQVLIFGVSICLLAALHALVYRSKFGKGTMAVAEDWQTASLLGIPVDFMVASTFFLSGALGGIAGCLVALSVSIAGPYFGIVFGLKGLSVIVLGGIGSIGGTVLAGWLLGVVEALVPGDASAFKDAVAFGILFLVLVMRPQGLLGTRPTVKV